MEPIRILHITYKMHCAGIESFIMNMYRNIDRTKVQFDFLVHYKSKQFYDDEIESMGGRIYRLSVREDNNLIKYWWDLFHFFKKHREYKIVHAHMESFALFYLPFAKFFHVPVIIAHSHNDRVDPNFRGFIKNIMNKPFKYLSNYFMACSKESGIYLFGKNTDCLIVPNAIDAKRFEFNKKNREDLRRELGIQDKFVLGHVGRFNTQKNHSFLIDVFNKVTKINKDAVLLLIGEGELRKEIEEKIVTLGLKSKVKFLGVRKDMPELFSAMDLFVFPSLYEGLGIVTIEAQASSLMCLCSDTIPPIARITNYFNCLNLSESTDIWAHKVCSYSKGYERISSYTEIYNKGFDVKKVAKQLELFYLSKYKNE